MKRDFWDCIGMLNIEMRQLDKDEREIPGSKQTKVVMYNVQVISQDEIMELLAQNRLFTDERVIITSPLAAQAFLTGFYPQVQGEVS